MHGNLVKMLWSTGDVHGPVHLFKNSKSNRKNRTVWSISVSLEIKQYNIYKFCLKIYVFCQWPSSWSSLTLSSSSHVQILILFLVFEHCFNQKHYAYIKIRTLKAWDFTARHIFTKIIYIPVKQSSSAWTATISI